MGGVSSRYQICVSGAAKGDTVQQGHELAEKLGKALAASGHNLLTGATTGLPEAAATAYKKAGGPMSLGVSPAASKIEHVIKYRLPTDCYDAILYTGLHYVGRDALLICSADAVIALGGRIGTLHEFTVSMETKTPVGFLHGAGGITDQIHNLLELDNAHKDIVLFDSDPEKLVSRLTALLDKLHEPYRSIYSK